MIYLIKFLQVIAILFLAFFWNKFILKKIHSLITADNNDGTNDSFATFSSNNNEFSILKYIQLLYWFIAIIVAILLVIQ